MEDYRVTQTGDEIQRILNQSPIDTADIAELKEAATSLDGRLESVEVKIPAGASEDNPLTDKQYVDDSIASSSATFRGTYNEVTDLELTTDATHADIGSALDEVIELADSNDYCFVQIPTDDETPTEIESIERYKFVTGTGWEYEYTLNNSGFTADQWSAINSGITRGLVTKLADLPTNAELETLLNGKANAADVYTKSETYNKTELDSMITTPDVQYVSVTATAQTTSVTDVLPATGAADTVYRVGSWDGTQYDANSYSEYAWNGTAYVILNVKNTGIATGSDFDNPTAAQRELLTTVGAVLDGCDATPTAGSVKPVQSGAAEKLNHPYSDPVTVQTGEELTTIGGKATIVNDNGTFTITQSGTAYTGGMGFYIGLLDYDNTIQHYLYVDYEYTKSGQNNATIDVRTGNTTEDSLCARYSLSTGSHSAKIKLSKELKGKYICCNYNNLGASGTVVVLSNIIIAEEDDITIKEKFDEVDETIEQVRSEIPDVTIDAVPTADAGATHAASSNGTYNMITSVSGRESNYKEDVAVNKSGDENASAGWGCTDFIPCAGNVSVKWSTGKANGGSNTQALVFYDSSKEKLAGYTANALTRTLTSHEDTAYLRASFYIENSSTVYVQESGVEVFKPLAGIDSVFKPVFDGIDNRVPAFELVGDNNILIKSVIYGSVKAGHKYRVYVKDRYIDSTGITSFSANTVRFMVSYTTDGENFTGLVLVGTNTKANPLKDSYDFELPIITASDPEDPDDVAAANAANAAMSIRIDMRATAGAKQVFLLEDITDATDINNLAVQIKDRVFNNDGFISLNLTAKLREFSDLFISTGNEIQSFVFFTDPHIYNLSGDAATNALETYITVIQRYYRNSPTDFVLCGGDWLQAGVDRQLSINRLATIDGICRNMLKPYYPLLGNHDLNNVGKESQEGYKIPQNVFNNLWFRQQGRAYYDWMNGNTRYFAFDTGLDNDHTMSEYRTAQLLWFANELLTNEAGHIILCIHIYKYTGFANYEAFVQYLISTAISFNARGEIELSGNIYDYTNAQGKVHCVLAGHSHKDFNEMNYGCAPSTEKAIHDGTQPIPDWDGIPVIGTVNAFKPVSGTFAATPNFDMMLVDYDNDILHAVRVGDYGDSRNIDLTTGNLIS